eukprot:CCRYP_011423-RA/>CCRYP_011423-RA protein AED:0.01 eAED:0.01 QI:73/1/1/1/1/1/2/2671/890
MSSSAQELDALNLYEVHKDATAALLKYREVWNEAKADGNSSPDAASDVTAISRRHNAAILENLSTLRGRRLRRRVDVHDGNVIVNVSDSSKAEGESSAKADPAAINDGHFVDVLTSVIDHLSVDAAAQQRGEKNTTNIVIMSESYNRLVAIYNLSLVHYSAGNINQALSVLSRDFHKILSLNLDQVIQKDEGGGNGKDITVVKRIIVLAVRMAFLVLDCIIRRHDGDGRGVMPVTITETDLGENKVHSISPEVILTWVEKNALRSFDTSDGNIGDRKDPSVAYSKDELKFRLHLYRSKLLLIGNCSTAVVSTKTASPNSDIGTRSRIARKELKSAMDLYQNKMCIDEKHDVNNDSKSVAEKAKIQEKQPVGSTKGGGSKLTKSRGSNQSDVSSVTSMAGGSLVTSTSDALWTPSSTHAAAHGGEGKGGLVVTGATFEGMPNKMLTGTGQSQVVHAQDAAKVKKENSDLHVQHEAVLYLKANLECLRGNTTKSLKLCSEARLAGRRSRAEQAESIGDDLDKGRSNVVDGPGMESEGCNSRHSPTIENRMASYYDEAIYYNNLALVHQSASKVHVALHYYSHALDCMVNVSQLDRENENQDKMSFFWSDGVARPDITAEVLSNTSVCALQAGDFAKAYICMARCVGISPHLFGQRARCWLRLAESCLGIYANLRNGTPAAEVQVCSPEMKEDGNVVPDFFEDPLPEAVRYLYKAIHLCKTSLTANPTDMLSTMDTECYESALVSLAYAKMELKDPVGALEACRSLIGDNKPAPTTQASKRHAICRLYAAEALCDLGDAQAALIMLFGSDNISEDVLKSDANSLDSPTHWLTQGFTQIDDDKQTVQVSKLIENQFLLYQLLKEKDTESAAILLRGEEYVTDPSALWAFGSATE